MKHFWLFMMAAILTACSGKKISANATDKGEDAQQNVLEDKQKSKEVDARKSITYKVTFRKDDHDQVDAVILDIKGGAEPQQFVSEFNWAKFEDFVGSAGEVSEEDVNFDGIPDLIVELGNFGVTSPLLFSDAFVWVPEKQGFECVEGFSSIANPTIEAKRKRVISRARSISGDVESEEVYGWKDGKLQMLSSSEHQVEAEDK